MWIIEHGFSMELKNKKIRGKFAPKLPQITMYEYSQYLGVSFDLSWLFLKNENKNTIKNYK